MKDLIRDLGYSIRRLLRSPGFSLTALSILSLAIGINTAAFSIINTLLFQPPPFEDSDRVVEILQDSDGGQPNSTSYPAFFDISEYENLFTEVGARSFTTVPLEVGDGGLIPVPIEYATSGYLPALGLNPFLGRWFEPAEDHLEAPAAAVITHRFWQNTFGSDPGIVGGVVELNGAPVTVVGVGPNEYHGGSGVQTAGFWVSISAIDDTNGRSQSLTRRQDHPLRVVARLAPGVPLDAARTEMDQLASRLALEYPDLNRNRRIHVLPIHRVGAENRSSFFPIAVLIMGIVGLVLLVASVNLANLMLVRGMSREREIGVRMALGGTRSRLVRVICGETIVLVLAGATLGLLLTYLLMTWLGKLDLALGAGSATNLDIQLDLKVFSFTMLMAGGASLVAGLIPALRLVSPSADSLVRERRSNGSKRKGRLTGTLVSLQVAGSLILLVAAGLFIDGAIRTSSADPGFNTENLAILGVDLNSLGVPAAERVATYDVLEERIQALPGVRSVSYTRNLPATPSGTTTLLVGDMVDGRRRPVEVPWNRIRDDFFSVMEIPFLYGRGFDERDRGDAPPRVVVNRAMAEAFWGRSDVVGEFYYAENAPDVAVEIVGVVETTKVASMDEAPTPLVYFNGQLSGSSRMVLLVRSEGPANGVLSSARQVIQQYDPRILILAATTMESYLSNTLGLQRLVARLLFGVGAFALILAAFGIYGVVSFNVSRRIPEVGIRMTLGAKRSSVVRLFVKETGILVGLGGLVGICLAIPLARFIGEEFTRTQEIPTSVFLACTVTLAVAALLATGVPARRAAYLNPAQTLRNE